MKAINRKYKNLKKENREKRKKYKFRIYSSRNNKNKDVQILPPIRNYTGNRIPKTKNYIFKITSRNKIRFLN